MTVTAKLLRLYLVDQQLRGLTGRLQTAEKYLADQDRMLADLAARHASLSSQLQQLEASNHNDEVEVESINARIASLRERMNNAKTSREHSAHLTEIGALKDMKQAVEDRMLDSMAQIESLRRQIADIDAQRSEREGVRQVALAEREKYAAEIKDRLDELSRQRAEARADVPAQVLAVYEQRLATGVEHVMAPIEEQDRRNLEYTCGACYTHLPIEQVSILLKRGDVVKCATCHAILYMEQQLREDFAEGQKKKAAPKKPKSKKSAAAAGE